MSILIPLSYRMFVFSYLHAPILILTKLANCSRIAELAGLISLFFKNRYVMGEKVQISCEGVKTTGVVVDIKCPAVEAYQRSVTLRSIRSKIMCVLGAVKLLAPRLI